MRKLLFALLALLMLMGSTVSFGAAQDDGTPEEEGAEAAEGSNPVDPSIGDTVTYFDENGDPIGNITINSIERGWEEYEDDFSAPERGMEYVAFSIVVESTIERGAIDVESYDFSVQTATGYLWQSGYYGESNAEPPLLDDAVSLASGDSEEFTLVYSVLEDEELAHFFWQPDSGVLITAANLEGE